jgi:hypothetical protein
VDDPRTPLVDELIDRLESVLTHVEEGGDPASLEQRWEACTASFETLRRTNEARTDQRVDRTLRRRLDHALRLHAIALNLLGRERDDLTGRLSEISGVRRRLRSADTRTPTGESCDVSA